MKHFYLPASLTVIALSACVGPRWSEDLQRVLAPRYTAVADVAAHQLSAEHLPMRGSAVTDIDNDGRAELFIGGDGQRPSQLLRYDSGRLLDISAISGFTSNQGATYGASSYDLDGDGQLDLATAGADGVHLYLNKNGQYQRQAISLPLPDNAETVGVIISDVDRDGDADLYISTFTNRSSYQAERYNGEQPSDILLINKGKLDFTPFTEQAGLQVKSNTRAAIFSDLDFDGWPDLVVAPDAGELKIFQNTGTGFRSVPIRSGFGRWSGLAIGDVDNDGDADLLASNSAPTAVDDTTVGDLLPLQKYNNQWLLLRNDGEFQFSNQTDNYGLSDMPPAHGVVLADTNLDGMLDIIAAQPEGGESLLLLQARQQETLAATGSSGRRFSSVPGGALSNPYPAQTPLWADLNGDGRPDVSWVNLGYPVRTALNVGQQPFISIIPSYGKLKEGQRVHVVTDLGRSYSIASTNGNGAHSSQNQEFTFGLGKAKEVKEVIIEQPGVAQRKLPKAVLNHKVRMPAK